MEGVICARDLIRPPGMWLERGISILIQVSYYERGRYLQEGGHQRCKGELGACCRKLLEPPLVTWIQHKFVNKIE